ncbi:MAG: alpha/beta hydrolase [Planctomycetia bacterium]|nr:alpha/beta hydrolase [Planctomycetia bacterium]
MRRSPIRSVFEALCIALSIGLPSAFGQPAAAPEMPAVAKPPAAKAGPPSPAAWAEKVKDIVDVRFDQSYAGNANPRQMVDVYLPRKRADDKPLPVVAMVHGGGWAAGDRKGFIGNAIALVRTGSYAAVAVGYRLSNEAKWPAQIHDCKAAIRWIRGHAAELGLDPDRIGVTGGSAGGHLSLMLGLTGGTKALDGSIGDCTDQPSGVACVVNYCGPSDLATSLLVGEKKQVPDSAVAALMGGDPSTINARAREASPLTYVTKDAPPVLTLHGTKDERVDFRHAEMIDEALKKAGATSYLVPVVNAGHGIPKPPQLTSRVDRFWERYLRGGTAELSTDPIEAPVQPAAAP